ncbi:MAG: hypothetical protein JWQ79_4228 [Mucilaginibacter sp.]|nr:hypothetical protein [Mucilaginibacter sp.]
MGNSPDIAWPGMDNSLVVNREGNDSLSAWIHLVSWALYKLSCACFNRGMFVECRARNNRYLVDFEKSIIYKLFSNDFIAGRWIGF